MRNVFDLVRDDYDYLAIEYQYDLLRRISKAMYDKGMITAGECQTHYRMYNPHSFRANKMIFLKKSVKRFGGFKKKRYLCIREMREEIISMVN